MTARLITIPFSHYCEKARWALDYVGVPFTEERYLPGMHTRAVKRARGGGRRDKASSSASTPLLILEDGTRIADSAAIVRWASDTFLDGALYAHPKAARWEQLVHDELAIATRALAYNYLFERPDLLNDLFRHNVTGPAPLAFRFLAPVIVPRVQKSLRLNADSRRRDLSIIDAEMEKLDAHLTGRAFMVGDTFSAADLATACALAPALVVQPGEGYGAYLPPLDVLPADYGRHVQRWRGTRSGEFALRMFREFRRQPVAAPSP